MSCCTFAAIELLVESEVCSFSMGMWQKRITASSASFAVVVYRKSFFLASCGGGGGCGHAFLHCISYEELYDVENLRAGYERLKRTTSPGIDGRIMREELTERGFERLSDELRRQRYAPKPAQRLILPTPEGGRPLSIACTVDKVVLSTLKTLTEPLFEPKFRESSHGFRPGRSCHSALRSLRSSWIGISWLVPLELKNSFQKVHHDILLKEMEPVMRSKSVEDLMRKILNAGYVDIHNLTNRSEYGTSQLVMGTIISPLCANVFLHSLDCYVEDVLIPDYNSGDMSTEAECEIAKRLKYLRYADSILLGVKGSKQDAVDMRAAVQSFLLRRLKLDIDEYKSPILNARSDMAKFLGTLIAYG